MKRYIALCLVAAVTVTLVSWGYEGHRTVGLIAARHLSPQAKAAVRDLLGKESLADVANWADSLREQPEYKHTFYWHFLNFPLGLNHAQFVQAINSMNTANGYSAILQQEKTLKISSSTAQQKAIALKFLVHFVGDLHQPMHTGRREDQGGNTIQVSFDGTDTNLHSLWDSKLVDKEGLTDVQLAKRIDKATPQQIRNWQQDNLTQWIWESYLLGSRLYAEVEQNNNLGNDYYQSHISIVNKRIDQAGIRLAGVLNDLFKNYKPVKKSA